jgi:hypothetical protein
MPRYFFNVRNGIGFVADDEGMELSGLEAARAVALKGARSIIVDEVLEGRLDLDGAIEVVDEAGNRLLTMTYRQAVSGREADQQRNLA